MGVHCSTTLSPSQTWYTGCMAAVAHDCKCEVTPSISRIGNCHTPQLGASHWTKKNKIRNPYVLIPLSFIYFPCNYGSLVGVSDGICGINLHLHLGSKESRKRKERRLNFKLGPWLPTESTNGFHSHSFKHIFTNKMLQISTNGTT